jgi:putative flippase GtrA
LGIGSKITAAGVAVDAVRSRAVHRELVSFVAVGAFNAAAYLLLASALKAFGLSTTLSSALAYAACVPPGYIAQRSWTFRSTSSVARSVPRYLSVQLVAWAVAIAATFVFAEVLGIPSLLSFAGAAASAAAVSFVLQRHWVF